MYVFYIHAAWNVFIPNCSCKPKAQQNSWIIRQNSIASVPQFEVILRLSPASQFPANVICWQDNSCRNRPMFIAATHNLKPNKNRFKTITYVCFGKFSTAKLLRLHCDWLISFRSIFGLVAFPCAWQHKTIIKMWKLSQNCNSTSINYCVEAKYRKPHQKLNVVYMFVLPMNDENFVSVDKLMAISWEECKSIHMTADQKGTF